MGQAGHRKQGGRLDLSCADRRLDFHHPNPQIRRETGSWKRTVNLQAHVKRERVGRADQIVSRQCNASVTLYQCVRTVSLSDATLESLELHVVIPAV